MDRRMTWRASWQSVHPGEICWSQKRSGGSKASMVDSGCTTRASACRGGLSSAAMRFGQRAKQPTFTAMPYLPL